MVVCNVTYTRKKHTNFYNCVAIQTMFEWQRNYKKFFLKNSSTSKFLVLKCLPKKKSIPSIKFDIIEFVKS